MWVYFVMLAVVAAAVWMFVCPEKEGSFVCPGCGKLKLAGEFDPEGDLCLACVALLDAPPEEEAEEEAEEEVSVEACLQILPTGVIRLMAPGAAEALFLPMAPELLRSLECWWTDMTGDWIKTGTVLVTILGHEIRFTWRTNRSFDFVFTLSAFYVAGLLAWASQVKERA